MMAMRIGLVFLLAGAACSETPLEEMGKADAGVPVVAPPDMAMAPQMQSALKLRVRSSDDLERMPARVIITAVPPTPPPPFPRDGAMARAFGPDALSIPDGVLLLTGEAELPLAAGTYELVFLQGPEYEQVTQQVTIADNAVTPLEVVLSHSVRTPGWLAADMHIHTGRSFDSKLLPAHRVVAEVAAGVEVLVPTDHIYHHDLQPYIKALGYDARAVSVPGSEYGFKHGHLGVYPVEFDPTGALWGAPAWEVWENWQNLTAELVFPMIHALPGQPMVVINHPRLLPDLGYFTNIGWPHTPDEPLASASLFDGLEILNGYESAPGEVTPLLRDWFYLLSQGFRITGLGNSDSHKIDWLTSGYPRTWLRLPTDDPARILPSDLREAILGMRAISSTGPWVNLRIDGREIGDTITPKPGSGTVAVEVEADAPSWIDLSHVLIYQNGVLVKDFAVPSLGRGHPALRVQHTLPISEDGWVVAMAVGDQPLPTRVIGAVRQGKTRPFATTNPIFIDNNGDGQVKPPPLPAGMPPLPFGAVSTLRQTTLFDAAAAAPPLHAPLDCEPDAYREWLFGKPE